MKKILPLLSILSALTPFAVSAQDAFADLPITPSQNRVSKQETLQKTPVKDAKSLPETPQQTLQKAEGGDARAQLAIGSFYATGTNGFQKNPAQAINWLTKSAEQNFQPAQLYLGVIYGNGGLVARDFDKAVYWRELAAKNGNAQEKWSLGNAYFFGYLVPKNFGKAVFWIEAAAAENHPEAVVKIVEIYQKSGDTENYNKWIKRFSELEVEAAKAGNVGAMVSIARKYLRGKDGLERNIAAGIFWYKRAADKGDEAAIEALAKMHARGRFVSKNTELAREYFMKLAEKNPANALKISNLYLQGKDGFPQDDKLALEWLERAAEKMDDTTRLYIAWRYWSGTNAPKDMQRAVYWCKRCKDNPAAEKMLKDIYQNKPAPKNTMQYFNGR